MIRAGKLCRRLESLAKKETNRKNMACNQIDYGPYHHPRNYSPSEPGGTTASGPHLILSNSPETVSSTATPTLYECEIPIPSGTTRIRVYVWHKNSTGSTAKFGTVVSLDSGSGTISNVVRQESATSGSLEPLGRCLAKAQRYNSMDSKSGISISTSEAFLSQYSATNNQVYGMVMEFDVTVSSACNFRFRSVIYTGSSVPGSFGGSVQTANNGHPRGWWPYANLECDCGDFDCDPLATPSAVEIICCKEDGPEETAFSKQESDTYGTSEGNEGLYGVNLTYKWDVNNESTISTGQNGVYLMALKTSANPPCPGYWGAAAIREWENRTDRGVPSIQWANPNNSDSYNNIVDLTVDGLLYVAAQDSEELKVDVANGGAATMPFMLILSKLTLTATPPDDSGTG